MVKDIFFFYFEVVGGINENFKRGCYLDWIFVVRDVEDIDFG